MSSTISPLDLLENKGNRENTFLFDKWNPLACATLGFVTACFVNFGLRKPVFAGFQQHVAFTAIGGGVGYYFDQKRNEHLAHRDAVLRHYVELHPEDFPPIERKKYGDVLEAWIPIR